MIRLLLILPLIAFVFSAFTPTGEISSIYGYFDPPESVKQVSAISGKDTVAVIPQKGKFSIAVHGGIWKLHIEAVPPYRDITTEYFKVTGGFSTDVGIIRITKQTNKGKSIEY